MAKKNNNWLLDDEDNGADIVVKDCNGNILTTGDTVIATQNLKVKGTTDIKRGDKFKNIRLTDDENLIESGKMVLKTEFFKKL